MITAPFNFVPLSDKVFFPPWSEQISHDVPFEDGESGVVDITITAKSPIFIRDHINPEEFCQHNGEYYIPSTSIKGMVRNVLEIMSFSKMSFFDDDTYAVRDLQNRELYTSQMRPNQIFCGWLSKTGEHYQIENCGEPYRVRYDEIDRYFSVNFKENFMKGTFRNASSPYKKAFEKYNLLEDLTNKSILNSTFQFSLDTTDQSGRKIAKFNPKGTINAKLVLTGHPSARKEPIDGQASGKIYDFAFVEQSNPTVHNVDKKIFEDFLFAYFDGRTTEPKESPDWKYWKQKLNNGEKIPVFFQKDDDDRVKHFGLSYLYKLPYNHTSLHN